MSNSKDNQTVKTNWDLSPLFVSEKDPRIEETEKVVIKESYLFINKWKNRSDYLEETATLKEALTDYECWSRDYGANSKIYFYFHLRTELDQNNPVLKSYLNKAKEVAVQIQNDIQFFTINLTKIPETTQKKFLADPELSHFKHFLELIFAESKFVLSEPEEKIINLYSDTSYANWARLVSNTLSKEEFKGYNFPRLLSTLSSTIKKDRDWAFKAINKILAKNADIAEAEMNSILAYKKVNDELRKTSRPDELRHVGDDIKTETVDIMLETVTQNFSIAHRFYTLKAKALGLKKIKYYEKTIPFGEADKKYSFDQAVKLVGTVLGHLDKEMLNHFEDFVKNGKIDVYPKLGRTDGAFCTHMRSADPTYILLNYTDQLRDVLTLAHEVGHGINNELIKKNQNEIYFDTPISTAEVASTFVEDFVLEEIGKQSDQKLKLSLMMAKLDDDISTIFRQVAAYRFEQELHQTYRQKGYLSKEEIGEIFLSHMKSYTGPAMEYPDGTGNWWIYWSHFRNFFYVYSYASGLLISKALQKKVRENNNEIIEVKKFLSAGTSASPADIFRQLDIDINQKNIWEEGLAEIERLLNETENLYNKLYDKKR